MNTSQMFTLNWTDVAKGVVVAVFSAAITYLYMATQVIGFSFSTVNWDAMLTVGMIAGVSYLFKNFVSNSDGKVIGLIG